MVIEELVEIKSIPFIRYLLTSSGFIPETSIIKFLLTSFFKLLIDKSLNSWTFFLIISGLNSPFTTHIIIEAENIEQAKEAVLAGADSVLLDELSPEIIKKNVQELRELSINSLQKEVNKNLIIEVSGINPQEISKYLIKGIDLISTSSSITKSNWIDLSMRYIN